MGTDCRWSDRLGTIFEDIIEGDQRNGTGFRAQCEGNYWESSLNVWLTEEKKSLRKVQLAHNAQHCTGKRKRNALPDPVLPDNIEQKLWAGLNLLKELAAALHVAVASSNPEPGCDCELGWHLPDTSLLFSTPFGLVPCSNAGKQVCGQNAVRFPEALRLKVPPKEAAPAADQPPGDSESDKTSALSGSSPH